MKILVIDGQGGRIGKQLIEELIIEMPDSDIVAVGTNSIATAGMIKGGAKNAATGENAVIVNSRDADVIVGPIGIVIADALLGEITPAMAVAAGQSPAQKILIPINRCGAVVVGTQNSPVSDLIHDAVSLIKSISKE